MRKMLWIWVVAVFCGSFFCAARVHAEDSSASSTMSLKDQLEADKAAIKTQKGEIKTNSQTARSEEKSLREQIRAARKAGDTAKVKDLETQLKTLHKSNVQEKQEDKKDLGDAKKELKQDRRAARATKRG